jgi:hypothetical protein
MQKAARIERRGSTVRLALATPAQFDVQPISLLNRRTDLKERASKAARSLSQRAIRSSSPKVQQMDLHWWFFPGTRKVRELTLRARCRYVGANHRAPCKSRSLVRMRYTWLNRREAESRWRKWRTIWLAFTRHLGRSRSGSLGHFVLGR